MSVEIAVCVIGLVVVSIFNRLAIMRLDRKIDRLRIE